MDDVTKAKARIKELLVKLDEAKHLFVPGLTRDFEDMKLERESITREIGNIIRGELGVEHPIRVCLCPRDLMTRYVKTRDWTHPVIVEVWDGSIPGGGGRNVPVDRFIEG
jgi:hypothetical protein